jgi:CBS domain-containing protein
MRIRDILSSKGPNVISIGPVHSILEAVALLVKENVGSLVVVNGGEVSGIITERDILRLAARGPHLLTTQTVGEVMTTELIVAGPDDRIAYAMEVMTRNRIRHLPVVGDGGVAGIVSIGDVVNALREDVEAENKYLKDYIGGTT